MWNEMNKWNEDCLVKEYILFSRNTAEYINSLFSDVSPAIHYHRGCFDTALWTFWTIKGEAIAWNVLGKE